MINAIIIDDEQKSGELLALKLKKYCPEVNILKIFNDSSNAMLWLFDHVPELVFLDIEMPGLSGLQLAEKISFKTDIVFVTAHQQYSIAAIKLTAFDYLLKPIDEQELILCINRFLEKKSKFRVGHEKKMNGEYDNIALPTAEGLHFVAINSIIKIEADSNYSTIYFIDRKKLVISKTLKLVENSLEHYNFFRANKSNLSNLNHIAKYSKGEGGTILLTDGTEIELSRSHKNDFFI